MSEKEKQEIFLELLEPVREGLGRFARAMARDRETARDLAQESILLAYESFDKLKDRSAFKSYLFSIARRLFIRQKKRGRIFGKYDEETAANLPSNGNGPEEEADIQILYNLIDQLPDKQKEVIVLFELSGFSIEEIKKIQGGTISGVKSRLRRGREKLQDMLKEKVFFSNNGYNEQYTEGASDNAGLIKSYREQYEER
ncbi:MAG: RNA polymerase sigma factor [Candidatus Kapaibacterium sp.]